MRFPGQVGTTAKGMEGLFRVLDGPCEKGCVPERFRWDPMKKFQGTSKIIFEIFYFFPVKCSGDFFRNFCK
jgi:hypothetical protein